MSVLRLAWMLGLQCGDRKPAGRPALSRKRGAGASENGSLYWVIHVEFQA